MNEKMINELIEEYKANPNFINKIRLKILESKFKKLKEKAVYNAIKTDYEKAIYEINKEYLDNKVEKKKIETSKLLMWFIVLNCSIVEAYSMWAMIYLSDLSPLTTLMAAVITESISFAVYCVKAYFGKKGEVDAELERESIEFEKERLGMLPEDNSSIDNFDDEEDAEG